VERWDGVMWTGLVWLRIGTGGEVGWVDVDWIGLAQDRDKCRALVNAVRYWETIEWLQNRCPLEQYSSPYSRLVRVQFFL
jgi:hypothetical protein